MCGFHVISRHATNSPFSFSFWGTLWAWNVLRTDGIFLAGLVNQKIHMQTYRFHCIHYKWRSVVGFLYDLCLTRTSRGIMWKRSSNMLDNRRLLLSLSQSKIVPGLQACQMSALLTCNLYYIRCNISTKRHVEFFVIRGLSIHNTQSMVFLALRTFETSAKPW